MTKIEKKIDKIFKKIGQKNPEDLFRLMVLTFLVLVSILAIYIQLSIYEVAHLKTTNAVPAPNYALETKIKNIVKGHPIENMVSQIAKKDEILAAYLVAIAKKESNWGERVPVLNGKDCYNYWGYRGVRDRMGSGGHTCFNSPTDAVNTISKRLGYFIREKGLRGSEDLIIWKCGSSCAGHSPESVDSWIQDVDYYYDKVME